jgi:hypothetical protein
VWDINCLYRIYTTFINIASRSCLYVAEFNNDTHFHNSRSNNFANIMAHEKIWVSLLNSATYRQDLEAMLMNVVYMRYRQLISPIRGPDCVVIIIHCLRRYTQVSRNKKAFRTRLLSRFSLFFSTWMFI